MRQLVLLASVIHGVEARPGQLVTLVECTRCGALVMRDRYEAHALSHIEPARSPLADREGCPTGPPPAGP